MLIAADLANMHDKDTMAAIHGTRISPLQDFGTTSVIKSTIKPHVKPVTTAEDSYGEEMDDDDFSDHDSHYSEDFIDDEFMHVITEEPPDVTQRLLSFAEMVNTDIQKYFGKKKDEDSCDIYEDKWVTTKSGRELYYADLLRIAQGENVDSKSSVSPKLESQGKQKFTGKMDAKIGLGPLNDLFEYGLRQFLVEGKLKAKRLKRMKQDTKRMEEVMPMNQRKLPDSFWREPGADRHAADTRVNNGGNLLNSSHPPDFSDLLQSWTGVGHVNDFGGDISSSEMSVTSSESL
ncbi:protein PERCC1-like [Pecten maximus]|uniref:protein PERCC1-like n=1 Tax=Pecten maximus TaxID=6579 RepID=UPI0014589B3B|nr:protein PERCC1-like [Pecten maximus]XP_033746717.1 protein PERCC1-like [Pecten maximus]XP_033746724.1 protein PERCC1-like [Pecten maximus]